MRGKQELGQLQSICHNQDGVLLYVHWNSRHRQSSFRQIRITLKHSRHFQYICGLVGLRTFLSLMGTFTFKVLSEEDTWIIYPTSFSVTH